MLEQSTPTYHVSQPLDQVDGVSHAARGEGVCLAGQCDFLIAVPVKSFDLGDSNRGLHMLQVVKGGQFPMVLVRFHLPVEAVSPANLAVDLELPFAGQTAHSSQIPLQCSGQGNGARISGTIPATLVGLQNRSPSLLAIPIKNDIPVKVEMTWRSE